MLDVVPGGGSARCRSDPAAQAPAVSMERPAGARCLRRFRLLRVAARLSAAAR